MPQPPQQLQPKSQALIRQDPEDPDDFDDDEEQPESAVRELGEQGVADDQVQKLEDDFDDEDVAIVPDESEKGALQSVSVGSPGHFTPDCMRHKPDQDLRSTEDGPDPSFDMETGAEAHLPVQLVPRSSPKLRICNSGIAAKHAALLSSAVEESTRVNASGLRALHHTESQPPDPIPILDDIETTADIDQIVNGAMQEKFQAAISLAEASMSSSDLSELNGVRAAGALPHPDSSSSCFHVQQVEVREPPEKDGSLGLLLSGNTVIAFTCPEAESSGWQVGDQIVKVNGRSCVSFGQFVQFFTEARNDGFPIVFSVLRCEIACDHVDTQCCVDDLLNSNNLLDIAAQMQRRLGHRPISSTTRSADWRLLAGSTLGSESIFDNPYVEALRKRRNRLSNPAEGWNISGHESNDHDSLASRLATRREGIATLAREHVHEVPEQTRRGPCGSMILCDGEEDILDGSLSSQQALRQSSTFSQMQEHVPERYETGSPCGSIALCVGDDGMPTELPEHGVTHFKSSERIELGLNAEMEATLGLRHGCSTSTPIAARTSRPLSAKVEPCSNPAGHSGVIDEVHVSQAHDLNDTEKVCANLNSVIEFCSNSELESFPHPGDEGIPELTHTVLPVLADERIVAMNYDAGIVKPMAGCSDSPEAGFAAGEPEVSDGDDARVGDGHPLTENVKSAPKGKRRLKRFLKSTLATVEENPFGEDEEEEEEEEDEGLDAFRKSLARTAELQLTSSSQEESSRNFAMQLVTHWGPAG